jgi:uncharacterized membrane protein YeiB
MQDRISGLDMSRALAVIGMIIVNFKVVIGQRGYPDLVYWSHLVDGKAAATFVMSAGVGLALMSRKARLKKDPTDWKDVQHAILKRALFLFIIGLTYISLWPADILHYYGIYMVFTVLIMRWSLRWILFMSTLVILVYPFLLDFWDYEEGWGLNIEDLEYEDFWTLDGFFRNLFYNGFHPVLPWLAFMLSGYAWGRQALHEKTFIRRTFFISTSSFLIIQWVSSIRPDSEPWDLLLGTQPMPPLPIYMLNGISFALSMISACLWLARQLPGHPVITILESTGKLALTFYVAHVVLGMGSIEMLYPGQLGTFTILFSLIYALIFSFICIVFAHVWLRYHSRGPLEWIMRKVTR